MHTAIRTVANLLRSKSRSFLTMTGIAVGVFAVVLISAISEAGSAKVSETLDKMGINSVLVQPETAFTATTLDDEDLRLVQQVKGVKKAMPLMAQTTEAVILNQYIDCYTWGVNKDAREMISLEAKHGRLISTQDTASASMVCVIDEDIAKKTYGRSNILGKTIKLQINGAYYPFEIVGIAHSGISTLQSALSNIIPNFAYIPITTMQKLSGRTTYDKLAVLLNTDTAGTEHTVAANIETKFQNERGEKQIAASNLLQQKAQLESIMRIITLILSLIAGISLFVSGLTVMTTMLVSVKERTREIGIKKSIGAKNSDILREFLLESAMLTLFGSAAGACIGTTVAFIGCFLAGISFVLNYPALLLAICISLFMGTLFGVYPAVKAANLEPIEALHG